MRRREDNAGGNAAVGQRETCGGGPGDRGGHAGDDLVWNIGLQQRPDFFARPAKDRRISTLEPNHDLTLRGVGDQQRIDFFLGQ